MAEEINLIVNVDKGNTKSVADVRKELEEAKKAATDTGKALGDGIAATETKTISLKAQLKAMKAELVGLDEGSARFKQLAKEAGALQDKIGDVNERVNALASDTKRLDSLVRIGGAITGGFQAAQGAMALFGTESKQVEKAIQNIIAAQGIMNGVQQVGIFLTTKQNGVSILDTTIKYANAAATKVVTAAQWLWNAALTANPIGLVVVAVGALSFGIYKLTKGLKDGTITIQDITKVLWRMIMPLMLIVDLYNYLYDAANKTETELEKGSRQNTERFNKRLAEIKAERAEQEKAHTERQEQFDRQIARYEAEGKSSYALRLSKLEDIKAEKIAILQSNKDIIQATVDRYTVEAQLRGKSLEEFLTSIGISYDTQKAFLEESLKDQEEAIYDADTAIIDLKREHNDKLKEEADKLAADEAAKKKKEDEDEEARQRKQIEDQMELAANKKKLLEDQKAEELKQREEDSKQAIADADAKNKKIEADEAASLEKRKAIQKAYRDSIVSLTTSIFTLTNTLGKKDEASQLKRAKRQFEIKKLLDMAEAGIDGTKAVLSTFANTPGGLIIKSIAATAAGAVAAAKIAAIGSAQFKGGNFDSNISADSNVGDAMQKTGEQQPKVQDLNNASTILNPEPQKVYVVESEMTAKQNKVKAIISEATF